MTERIGTDRFAGLLGGASLALALMVALPVAAQQSFPSPEAAADAFVEAIATNDGDGLRAVLGADWKRYIPTYDVDAEDRIAFLQAGAEKREIVRDSDDTTHLAVGPGAWTLPIPIVKKGDGWRFDTRAGSEEIRIRRIGRNELAAIQAALAYGDAQREYALHDHNGDDVPEYAQRLISTPGHQDGLYWAALPGEPDSPLGPFFGDDAPGGGYQGYHFRILTAQGADARGGAYNYIIGKRMTGGFALVAWPIRYGDSGVMTFIINHDGEVYEKDLGPNTNAVARAMKSYEPDDTWGPATP